MDRCYGFMQTAAKHLDVRVDTLSNKLKEQIIKMSEEDIAKLSEASVRTLKMDEARLTRADLQRDQPAPKR